MFSFLFSSSHTQANILQVHQTHTHAHMHTNTAVACICLAMERMAFDLAVCMYLAFYFGTGSSANRSEANCQQILTYTHKFGQKITLIENRNEKQSKKQKNDAVTTMQFSIVNLWKSIERTMSVNNLNNGTTSMSSTRHGCVLLWYFREKKKYICAIAYTEFPLHV